MKIVLVSYQTVHTVLFLVTTLTENEVNVQGYKLKQPNLLLHFSSQKIINETESRLLFLDKYRPTLNRTKVSKGAKIRNRYNQVPHLTQDTNAKVTNSQ